MAKRVNAGQLNTEIIILEPWTNQDQPPVGGVPAQQWRNVFGAGSLRCQWVNAHGQEVLSAKSLQYKDLATLTLRYSPRVTVACRVQKIGDAQPFEIIGLDDVENRHAWLELKVRRAVTG